MVNQERFKLVCECFWSVQFLMRILSWNVQGLGSKKKRGIVKGFLRSQDLDIVLLQETKRENWDKRFLVGFWTGRDREWIALPTCGASGGVVIIWDSNKFECIEKLIGSFSVSMKLESIEEGSFWLTSMYGPSKT